MKSTYFPSVKTFKLSGKRVSCVNRQTPPPADEDADGIEAFSVWVFTLTAAARRVRVRASEGHDGGVGAVAQRGGHRGSDGFVVHILRVKEVARRSFHCHFI